jgi:hypothetical protein
LELNAHWPVSLNAWPAVHNQLSKTAPNEQHDHSSPPLLDRPKGDVGDELVDGGTLILPWWRSHFWAWLVTSKSATQQELHGKLIVQSYSPELIQTMRAALDEVMTKIPLEQATPGIKAAVAECIKGRSKWSDQLRRPDRSSLGANSDNSFDADVSERYGVYADEKAMACLEFMEKRRAVLIGALGLTVGALSFWITLSLVDYGFWGVLHAVFP